jgi:hypothetical protein
MAVSPRIADYPVEKVDNSEAVTTTTRFVDALRQ